MTTEQFCSAMYSRDIEKIIIYLKSNNLYYKFWHEIKIIKRKNIKQIEFKKAIDSIAAGVFVSPKNQQIAKKYISKNNIKPQKRGFAFMLGRGLGKVFNAFTEFKKLMGLTNKSNFGKSKTVNS